VSKEGHNFHASVGNRLRNRLFKWCPVSFSSTFSSSPQVQWWSSCVRKENLAFRWTRRSSFLPTKEGRSQKLIRGCYLPSNLWAVTQKQRTGRFSRKRCLLLFLSESVLLGPENKQIRKYIQKTSQKGVSEEDLGKLYPPKIHFRLSKKLSSLWAGFSRTHSYALEQFTESHTDLSMTSTTPLHWERI